MQGIEGRETYDHWLNLGCKFIQQRKYVEAEAAFLRGLEVDPTDAVIMSYLGSMYWFRILHAMSLEQKPNPELIRQAIIWYTKASEHGYTTDRERLQELRNLEAGW